MIPGMRSETGQVTGGAVGMIVVAALLAVGLLVGGAFGCKEYSRYQLRQDARNNLVRAESENKIKVQEAIAARESAVKLKQAEITRAEGVAAANEIINGSITPNYLRYFYIQQLSEVEHLGGKIIMREIEDEERRLLEAAVKIAAADGAAAETAFISGYSICDAIVRIAREQQCDLIVMTSHERHGLSSFLVESETQQVLTHTAVPVLVVR